MLDFDEHIVNLLIGLVHLRLFEFEIDDESPVKNDRQFIMRISDRVPHREYFSMSYRGPYYKRVGGELVICDRTECPWLEFE